MTIANVVIMPARVYVEKKRQKRRNDLKEYCQFLTLQMTWETI